MTGWSCESMMPHRGEKMPEYKPCLISDPLIYRAFSPLEAAWLSCLPTNLLIHYIPSLVMQAHHDQTSDQDLFKLYPFPFMKKQRIMFAFLSVEFSRKIFQEWTLVKAKVAYSFLSKQYNGIFNWLNIR